LSLSSSRLNPIKKGSLNRSIANVLTILFSFSASSLYTPVRQVPNYYITELKNSQTI